MSRFIIFDFETMGVDPKTSSIRSLGAFAFDALGDKSIVDDIYNESNSFYINVIPQSNEEFERSDDPRTVAWWNEQRSDAQKIFKDESLPLSYLGEVPYMFDKFLDKHVDKNTLFMCRGIDFDYLFLKYLYAQEKLKFPFSYNAIRDIRSVVDTAYLMSGDTKWPFNGYGFSNDKDFKYPVAISLISHFALHDCMRDAMLINYHLNLKKQ